MEGKSDEPQVVVGGGIIRIAAERAIEIGAGRCQVVLVVKPGCAIGVDVGGQRLELGIIGMCGQRQIDFPDSIVEATFLKGGTRQILMQWSASGKQRDER